ncbi:MAG: hypothetical protein L6R37_001869 [Teloschistes peruensis]|nr:MAG: hypothetical protein L6R37_001869 [Teloschistes peruensis]
MGSIKGIRGESALSLATTHNAPLDQIFQSFGTSLSQFLTTQNITRVFPVQLVLALPIISGTVSQNISSPSLQRLATLWTDATQRAPLLSQSLYPSIPTAQQTITLTSITAQNASIDPLHILDDTMNSILDPLANVSSFLDFTRMGTFSDPSTDTAARVLNDRYADLNVGVNTFVTGKMMQDNGYFAIPRASAPDGFAPIVDCLNATNTTCVMANGTVFFWSLTTHRLYELQSSSSAPPVATNDLLDQIERLRWANLQLLFDGAYNCTFSGKSGGQNPVVSVTDAPDGTWSTNVGCISQLPMYLDCDADCPAYAARGRNRKINSSACLFGYQPGC